MNCIRYKSKNDEYHIILNFIKELKVFSNLDDRRKFIQIMVEVMKKMDCKIYAHAIMHNHIHMIIKEGKEKKISSIVISLCTRFAKYYNKKYNRKGKLFSRRYKSIPINDEIYFFRLFRYILRNPVKAGLLDCPWDYSWSSARAYKTKEGDFYFPEVLERYECSFKYHPYTVEEFVGFKGDDHLVYYLNQITNNDDKLMPPFKMEDFLNSAIDDNMILKVNLQRYYDDEAMKVYNNELMTNSIDNLLVYSDVICKKRVIFRMRQIGLTLVQIRKFSGMTMAELKSAMYPS